MAEKRNQRRIRRRLSLRFGVDKPVRLAFTEDVTEGGLFIKTTNLYRPGTRVFIEIILPDESRVRVTGSIRWTKKVPPTMIHLVRKAGMGVKFLRFEEGEERFRDFMDGAQAEKHCPSRQGATTQ